MIRDRHDIQILERLQIDASLSNQELAESVGLSVSPCWRRVKRMEESGVITGYVAMVDHKSLGLPIMAFAHISLDDHHTECTDTFDAFVQATPRVLECCSLSGQYDYLLRIVSSSMEDYERFLSTELLRLSGVRSVNTSFVLNQKKFTTALPLTL